MLGDIFVGLYKAWALWPWKFDTKNHIIIEKAIF